MKLGIIIGAALALALTPALAHKKAPPVAPPKQEAKKECHGPDELIKEAPESFKFLAKLEGDALAKFASKADEISAPGKKFPRGPDMIVVMQNDEAGAAAIFFFEHGCVQGYSVVPIKVISKLLADESI
jgi:hypothetical protein